ncbi:GntR family transcriptional regulator [Bacillus horti]|uniref:DNA-binding GntR family transcriptional regulator n=1 Tax=Caldalkalibacillus horti TaxID=77523 RepID=A0ABT9VVN3_9BACI|nr:GntR family transcriptional regulator [Bacillus horti]MDQ0165051.1 DNA-binding GntR family transcriptional regulator [Bacillus horti]
MEYKSIIDNRNLSDRIYIYLRDKIINNEMVPGARIIYDELIEELGVSRTPLREALTHLQQDGLIEVRPRSGTFVNTPKLKDIEEIYDVRRALEVLAIELAVPRIPQKVLEDLVEEAIQAEKELDEGNVQAFFTADRNLHKTLIRYSQNQRLLYMMQSIEAQIQWFGVIITRDVEGPKQANQRHKQILEALLRQDVDAAKELMATHITEIKEETIHKYSEK